MTKEYHYVDCNWCNIWDQERLSNQVCPRCNNTRKVIDPIEILCNLCGGPMCPVGTVNEQVPHGLYRAQVMGGYDSYHLLDLNTYTFSFCEKCLRELFIQCKVKPQVEQHNADCSYSFDDDQKIYEYWVWKDNGGHHQAYLNRRCNFEKDCPNEAVYTQLHNADFTENCSCEKHKDLHNYSNSKLVKFISNMLKPFL